MSSFIEDLFHPPIKESLPNEQVDDAMIAYLHKIYQHNDVAIIDGRSAGFSLQEVSSSLKKMTEAFLNSSYIGRKSSEK